jgi:hypothetical protein
VANHQVPSSFDDYPNTAFVNVAVAAGILGVSVATIWRMIGRQELKSQKISLRSTRIQVGEIRRLAGRVE